MRDNKFHKDDFLDIKKEYFNRKTSYFNPAHATSYNINSPKLIESSIKNIDNIIEYNNDYTKHGIYAKKSIINILKMSDFINITPDEITITPSITTSSLIVLRTLIEMGINKVWLDTPCYYATLFQIESLGLKYELIPTYREENFIWNKTSFLSNEAVWITQPRISLSRNQDRKHLEKLVYGAKNNQYMLVIDEATELNTPSIVSKIISEPCANIIRLKGIYKPLAINGPRISYIIHNKKMGRIISKWIWTFHGGIDSFSINSLPKNKKEIYIYIKMLKETLNKAKKAHQELKTQILGTKFKISEYENGYTSCIEVDLLSDSLNFYDNRIHLIKKLEKNNMFPTLGSSMYFAFDGKHEFIRVNLFTDIKKLGHILSNIY